MYAILGAWRTMPHGERAVMRSYTAREQRTGPDELDIEFALHEDGGPACRRVGSAGPGDRVVVRFRPPEDADAVVIWADETPLPATSAILEWLSAGTRARVFPEVPHSGDRTGLPTAADAEVTWLVREEGAPSAVDAVRDARLPGDSPYVWMRTRPAATHRCFPAT